MGKGEDKTYDADSIAILEGLEAAVRKRPGNVHRKCVHKGVKSSELV